MTPSEVESQHFDAEDNDEHATSLGIKQALQFTVLGVGDERGCKRPIDGLVIGDLVLCVREIAPPWTLVVSADVRQITNVRM